MFIVSLNFFLTTWFIIFIMNIISFKNLDSTNTYAKQNLQVLEDKMVVSADFQSAGYGRFARSWIDLGTENIYMTFVLKPSEQLSSVHANLTQYLSVVLCKQLEELGLLPHIKWPNDVLLNGKKVCGILAETVLKGGVLKGIVLGIGVNLNASVSNLDTIDRPATSVNLELGHAVDKHEFMKNLVERFFENYDEFLKNGFLMIKNDYEKRSTLGQNPAGKGPNVCISVFNSLKVGIFNGFDDDGTLLLLVPEGEIEKINMGEIVEREQERGKREE